MATGALACPRKVDRVGGKHGAEAQGVGVGGGSRSRGRGVIGAQPRLAVTNKARVEDARWPRFEKLYALVHAVDGVGLGDDERAALLVAVERERKGKGHQQRQEAEDPRKDVALFAGAAIRVAGTRAQARVRVRPRLVGYAHGGEKDEPDQPKRRVENQVRCLPFTPATMPLAGDDG